MTFPPFHGHKRFMRSFQHNNSYAVSTDFKLQL